MADICRGCCSKLENIEKAKNVFIDALFLESNGHDEREDTNLLENLSTVYSSLQLITGYNVSKTDGLSPYLCEDCTKKLIAYVTFRRQLLSAQSSLLNSQNLSVGSNDIIKNPQIEGTDPAILLNNTQAGYGMRNMSVSLKDEDQNTCSNFFHSPKPENDANDIPRVPIDEGDDQLNDSDNSNLSVEISICKENVVQRNEEHDIESDIDVCSGEDHEVLELDLPSKRNETVEIGSSSESDIEVCDHDSDLFICVVKRAG